MATTPAAQRWAAVIGRHEASGLTIRQFAKDNGLNAGTLAWWRSRLRREARMARRPQAFVELEVAPVEQNEGTLSIEPVVLCLDAFDARIVVEQDTDLELVRRLVDALC